MANDETQHLVSMANDIAANLASYADSAARTTGHIKLFWTPRMRAMLFKYASAGGVGLSEISQQAVGLLQDEDKLQDDDAE